MLPQDRDHLLHYTLTLVKNYLPKLQSLTKRFLSV